MTTPGLPALLQGFFTGRLMQQRQASAHTIASYRDSFRLLLRFAQQRLGVAPQRLAFEQVDAPLSPRSSTICRPNAASARPAATCG